MPQDFRQHDFVFRFFQQENVEIAQLIGEFADVCEIGSESFDNIRTENAFDLRQGGAAASHCNPEVVQELRVDVVFDAGFVASHGVEKMAQYGSGCFAGGHFVSELDVQFGRIVSRLLAGSLHDHFKRACRNRLHAECGQEFPELLQFHVISAHRRQPETEQTDRRFFSVDNEFLQTGLQHCFFILVQNAIAVAFDLQLCNRQ